MTTRHRDRDDFENEALAPFEDDLAALAARHRRDPALDVLRAALAEALPDPMQQEVSKHLETSPWARALVEGTNDVDVTLDADASNRLLARIKREGAGDMAESRRTWRSWPVLAFASAAVLAVAVVVWYETAPPAVTSVATRTPVVQAPPAAPAFTLELTKPDVKLTPMALLLRGEGNAGRFVDEIAAGLDAYRGGDYARAARELEAVQPRYPKAVEAPFYAGVSRLMLNDLPAAVRDLESARALGAEGFSDDVAWYLAVAYERGGAIDQSRALIDGLCSGRSMYASRACEAAGRRR